MQINRQQIIGQGDSAAFNKLTEQARLMRNASIVSRDTAQPFRLAGDTIDLYSTDRQLDRVIARHRAQATSNDVLMRAERVEMRLDSQRVEQAWAFGPGRAFAETARQSLEADSLDILMPAQVLRELHAVGAAVAFATPDSTRIANPERDVLAGDTIFAYFDTVTVAPDTLPGSRIREIIAILSASARYQLPSSQGPSCPPGINYVRGRRIVVAFDSGTVQTVSVDSQASGVYLEAAPDSLGDSLAVRCTARPDSGAATGPRPDSIRPDTGGSSPLAYGGTRTRPVADAPRNRGVPLAATLHRSPFLHRPRVHV